MSQNAGRGDDGILLLNGEGEGEAVVSRMTEVARQTRKRVGLGYGDSIRNPQLRASPTAPQSFGRQDEITATASSIPICLTHPRLKHSTCTTRSDRYGCLRTMS